MYLQTKPFRSSVSVFVGSNSWFIIYRSHCGGCNIILYWPRYHHYLIGNLIVVYSTSQNGFTNRHCAHRYVAQYGSWNSLGHLGDNFLVPAASHKAGVVSRAFLGIPTTTTTGRCRLEQPDEAGLRAFFRSYWRALYRLYCIIQNLVSFMKACIIFRKGVPLKVLFKTPILLHEFPVSFSCSTRTFRRSGHFGPDIIWLAKADCNTRFPSSNTRHPHHTQF